MSSPNALALSGSPRFAYTERGSAGPGTPGSAGIGCGHIADQGLPQHLRMLAERRGRQTGRQLAATVLDGIPRQANQTEQRVINFPHQVLRAGLRTLVHAVKRLYL